MKKQLIIGLILLTASIATGATFYIHDKTAKSALSTSDVFGIEDSEASWAVKKVSMGDLSSWMLTGKSVLLGALSDLKIQGTTETAGSFTTSRVYKIVSVGSTDFTLIGASASTVGVEFTATGAGSGTGTANPVYPLISATPTQTNIQVLPAAQTAPLTSPVFSTSLALPQSASPTVDAAGEIAVDTTSDQLIYYGGAKRVLTYKKQENFVVKSPADADDFLLMKAQTGITITGIHCIIIGGTSISVDIQECDSAGANCASVDAAITCDADGADGGAIANPTIEAGNWLKVVLGAPSGVVGFVTGSINYVETAD